MTTLAELAKAEAAADAQRRAVAAVPEVFRPPGAARQAWTRREAAHQALARARAAQMSPEAGQCPPLPGRDAKRWISAG